jgi:FAD/FMN-containing dehydrogenase
MTLQPEPKALDVSFDGLHLSPEADLVHRERASSDAWAQATYRWSQVAETNPIAVAYPANVDDVQAIVRFARKAGVRIAVKGGGHAQWACNGVDDGLNIDLKRIKWVRLKRQSLARS